MNSSEGAAYEGIHLQLLHTHMATSLESQVKFVYIHMFFSYYVPSPGRVPNQHNRDSWMGVYCKTRQAIDTIAIESHTIYIQLLLKVKVSYFCCYCCSYI